MNLSESLKILSENKIKTIAPILELYYSIKSNCNKPVLLEKMNRGAIYKRSRKAWFYHSFCK